MKVDNVEIKEKITTFNKLMKEISEILNNMFIEGKEKEFHDVLLDMIKSLDHAQQTVRKAYNLFLSCIIKEN